MAILYFTDILQKVGLDPKEVKLIRHSASSNVGEQFTECLKQGKEREFTQHQKKGFGEGYPYWITFVADGGTYARLLSCYRVHGSVPDTTENCPAGLPLCEAQTYRGEDAVFDLEYVDALKEYEGKLVIDWGRSAVAWNQKATNEKPIVAIESKSQRPFVGFESLMLTFDELKEVVENGTDYELWHAAMASVDAIYLIVDTKTGDQYVGSTYGQDGLLQRWTTYVKTGGHGGNKLMKEHLENHSCHDLQWSVLQVLPKSLSNEQIIATEQLWKDKLGTRAHGLNLN